MLRALQRSLPRSMSRGFALGQRATNGVTPASLPGRNASASIVYGAARLTAAAGGDLTEDFLARVSHTSVVWWHDFSSAGEVNQFRWTGSYSGGNDPNGSGSGAGFLTQVASGGADGGGFLRSQYPSGATAGRGNSYWWRPFNPITGATNGKGADDPGANGSVAAVAFPASDGSQTTNRWTLDAANPGWYGSASDQAANPTEYQGGDFYLQIRVRRAQTPGAPPDAPPFTFITGKNVWLTTTNSSFTTQELVTYGQSQGNDDEVGVLERHNVYSGQNFTGLGDGQPNATLTVSNLTVDWRYSGGWDTLLYHVTPGTNGGTGANRTRVEVWAQHDPSLFPAESGVYTKIWDVTYSQSFDTGTGPAGGANLPGWNALILGSYHNGSQFASTFNFDYDQVIFSKAHIVAPGGASALAKAAAGMASGEWLNFGSVSGTTGLGNFTGGTGASGVRTPYMSEFTYDHANKRCIAHTGDHNENAFLFIYNEATNAWSIDHTPTWADIGGAATARHGYDHNVFVPSVGTFYSRTIQNLNLRKWNGGTSWTDIAIPLGYATSAAGQCYHAALDKILVFQLESGINGALVGMDPDTESWTTYVAAGSGTLANTGDPHNFAVYNPTSQIAWFGGGNSVTTNWTISASGTVNAADAIPGPLGMIGPGSGPSLALANPANGNFIVWFDADTWYDFNATARTYSARGGTSTAFSSNMLAFVDGAADGMAGVMGCTLHEYGVFAFVKAWSRTSAAEMWLFKP